MAPTIPLARPNHFSALVKILVKRFGAVIDKVLMQVDVTVSIIAVPAGTPVIVQLLPLGFVTMPAVLVTIPMLTVTETE